MGEARRTGAGTGTLSLRRALSVVAAAALVAAVGCDLGSGPKAAARPASAAPRHAPPRPPREADAVPAVPAPDPDGCVPGVPTLPPDVQRGMSFAHSWERGGAAGYGTPAAQRSLRELRGLGVDWVSITPFGYVRSLSDARVRVPEMRAAETDARVVAAFGDARASGMRVFYKPHVWVGGGDWVGRIDPGSPERWDAWWASYRSFVLHHARLAAAHDVPIFAVGVELKTTSVRFADRWRALVRAVRQVYPGKLTYAANWDEVVDVPWWDQLDYVGIQFYPPVAYARGETEAAKRARLEGYLDHLEALHERTGKPILFTEVGYRSRQHPEIRPHAWPEHDRANAPPPSERAQAVAYRRFLQGIAERPWIAGVYWWKWFSNPESREEGPDGFSPRGKRAAGVMGTAYRRGCGG